MKREEVDRRVKEDAETYSEKFSDDAKCCCMQVREAEDYMTVSVTMCLPVLISDQVVSVDS